MPSLKRLVMQHHNTCFNQFMESGRPAQLVTHSLQGSYTGIPGTLFCKHGDSGSAIVDSETRLLGLVTEIDHAGIEFAKHSSGEKQEKLRELVVDDFHGRIIQYWPIFPVLAGAITYMSSGSAWEAVAAGGVSVIAQLAHVSYLVVKRKMIPAKEAEIYPADGSVKNEGIDFSQKTAFDILQQTYERSLG